MTKLLNIYEEQMKKAFKSQDPPSLKLWRTKLQDHGITVQGYRVRNGRVGEGETNRLMEICVVLNSGKAEVRFLFQILKQVIASILPLV